MISPHVLVVLMWSVIATWALTVVIIVVEFQARKRRSARAEGLVQQLTSGAVMPGAVRRLTRSEFQGLVHAGLPPQMEVALAEGLRSQHGDERLLALATGAARGSLDERIEALQVVVSGRHPHMYGALAGALRAQEGEIAAMGLRLLRSLDTGEAARVLVDALADGAYSGSRIAAALDLMTTDKRGLLLPLLQHESQTVRFWGLLLAGRTRASEWVSVVRTLVLDRSPMVRRAAVEALGRLGMADDRQHVVGRFMDPSAMVRVHAARAAAAFPDAAVADALVKLLSDREWIVRAAARDSLKALGAVATPAVTRALWQGDAFASNNAAEVLFLTGAAVTFINELLLDPTVAERRRLVERLLAASGPQIVRAVHDQLDSTQQAALQRLMDETLAPFALVRNR